MQGLVTLLPPHLSALTEALWAELASTLGLRGVYTTPFPHFSYHVALDYDPARLAAALAPIAAAAQPFTVTTTGLAAFTGPAPVLYLPVVRTAELSAFHALVWHALEPTATGSQAHYAPAAWVPHITLALGDLTPATLADATRHLADRAFNWQFAVDNLTHISDLGGQQFVASRLPLGSP